MSPRSWWSLLLALPLVASACGFVDDGETDKGSLSPPPFEGKADVGNRVIDGGSLSFGPDGAVTGVFDEDLQFFGWRLTAREGAQVTLEVTQLGSSRGLDTTLFLYGPRSPEGGFGTSAIAYDDDSGWGALSRLRDLTLPTAGEYLVVVGTYDGRGRGNFRLMATCSSEDCSLLPEQADDICHPVIVDAVLACVDDSEQNDPAYDPSVTSRIDLIEVCADAEPVASSRDSLCAEPEAPALVCEQSMEEFATGYLADCRREIVNLELDASCVFGTTYPDIRHRPGAVIILAQRTLTAQDSFTDIERAQILDAVRMTAYDDVTTVEEAFASVDDNRVNVMDLWDASNRLAFTSYEVGAGDNSFGAIFEHGTTVPAALIQDSDLMDCSVFWGKEMRACEESSHCKEGLTCVGLNRQMSRGRCIDTSRDNEHFLSCSASDPCPADLGLVCAGGICNPGWMRGRFVSETDIEIPDADPAGAEAQLPVYGLGTVSTDVTLDLWVSHGRPSDLTISIINPAGTEVVIFDREEASYGVSLYSFPVLGFPGDETANGIWRVSAVDGVTGMTGRIGSFALTVTSRWD